MVSLLISRSNGLGLSPGWGYCVVYLGKTLNSRSTSLHPSTRKLVLAILLLGEWGRNTPSFFMVQKWISYNLIGHLAHMQT